MKSPLGSIVRAGNIADGDANANISESERRANARKAALEEAKWVLSSLSPPSEAAALEDAAHDGADSKNPPPPPAAEETPDFSKITPKSRSDAVAAAKRRAEERRKGSASALAPKHGSPAKSYHAAKTASAVAATSTKTTSNITATNQMDWFNLLGPVANPSGHDPNELLHYGWSSAPASTHSGHRRPSRHGLSGHSGHSAISSDHMGSDTTVNESYASSLLAAAGMTDLALYTRYAESSTQSAMDSMASGLDEFTGWFDHYSRKYLGTMPGIDGGSLLDGNDEENGSGGIVGGLREFHPVIWEEYEPEFGPEDVPELQRERLPEEIEGLDLGSVEEYLRRCGMLGMRFEDRGGGFRLLREKMKKRNENRGQMVDDESGMESTMATTAALATTTTTAAFHDQDTISDVANAIEAVPEIFFSPYFDLTDPICFEKLLVVSDEEVAEIRAKEAKLHALAEQKVREAEEVAKEMPRMEWWHRDLRPGNLRLKLRMENHPTHEVASGASLTKDAHRTNTPTDGNVITLRKPETFTSHLDAIELALLDQVRSKSDSFFRETNRFSELQHLVTASVDEVRNLRTDLQSLRERCVTNVELVPIMDDSRRDLRAILRVLEAAEDVVNCKASIASLMSAGDHLGAVEAIRLARSLLAAPPIGEDDTTSNDDDLEKDDVSTSNDDVDANGHPPQHKLCLGKLKALSKVGEQLNEYEKLVVRNLTDELVDTFLSWGSSQNSGGDDTGNTFDYRSPPRVALSFDRRSKIRGVVQSLRLCGQLSGAGVAYQKRLCELISVTVKAIVTECVADAATAAGSGAADQGALAKGTMAGVASMSLEQFLDCINMLFEQVLGLLWGAVAVNKFCIEEGIILNDKSQAVDAKASASSSAENAQPSGDNAQHTPSATAASLAAAADLAEKSVSELLRLRREAHSLVSFDGMRQLWDTSLTFTLQLERFSGRKAYGLRSTLLSQAKSFVERKHEANMSTLVAALDSERWVQCNVSAERQAALNRLCSGRAAFTSRNATLRNVDNLVSPSPAGTGRDKMADAEVEGVRYKVVWSCLLLLEMVMDDVACAAHFQTLATNVVGKVAELFRLFNTRSTQLVLGAGAIHSAARLKSINAKHLSIVTQCLALVLAILPHVRAALMAQLPVKQHALLSDLDKIKQDYSEHNEKILGKLVSIIGGIVEHSLAAKIPQTDFDTMASTIPQTSKDGEDSIECSPFIDSVVSNTKKMHQVLNVMLPPELLRDVFSRIFAYLDHKVPSLYKELASENKEPNAACKPKFSMPTTDNGKRRMINEVEYMATTLNRLTGVQPWHFTATKVLAQELDIEEEESVLLPLDERALRSESESDEKKEMEADIGLASNDSSAQSVVNSSQDDVEGKDSAKGEDCYPTSNPLLFANTPLTSNLHAVQSNGETRIDEVEAKDDTTPLEMKIDSEHSADVSKLQTSSSVSDHKMVPDLPLDVPPVDNSLQPSVLDLSVNLDESDAGGLDTEQNNGTSVAATESNDIL
eukprot:CCRYP_010965-RA/>CCRYP_010965-RA protein AED:0.07 eAED:0.07 QI:0/0/0/1/1/1/4/0/1501